MFEEMWENYSRGTPLNKNEVARAIARDISKKILKSICHQLIEIINGCCTRFDIERILEEIEAELRDI